MNDYFSLRLKSHLIGRSFFNYFEYYFKKIVTKALCSSLGFDKNRNANSLIKIHTNPRSLYKIRCINSIEISRQLWKCLITNGAQKSIILGVIGHSKRRRTQKTVGRWLLESRRKLLYQKSVKSTWLWYIISILQLKLHYLDYRQIGTYFWFHGHGS